MCEMSTTITSTLSSDTGQLKLAVLINAARISPMVNETTIGPKSFQQIELEEENPLANRIRTNSKHDETSDQTKWRTDIWQSLTIDDNSSTNWRRNLNVNDCKVISFQIAQNSAEKARKNQIRNQVKKKQSKFDELADLFEQTRITSAEATEAKRRENTEIREAKIQKTLWQIDQEAFEVEEDARKEQIEHDRKTEELSARLQREEERSEQFRAIKSLKELFIAVFEKFVSTILTNKQDLTNFSEYFRRQEQFLARYTNVFKTINTGQLSAAEVASLETICDDIKDSQRQLESEIARNSEDLKRRIAETVRNKQETADTTTPVTKQKDQKQVDNLVPQNDTNKQLHIDATSIAILSQCVHPMRFQYYQEIMRLLAIYEQSVKPLESDDQLSKFRFNCKKAVNIPLNSICAKSSQHLQDKFNKVSLVLSGSPVKVNDTQFVSSSHPLGIKYCTLLVAKRFVNLADTEVSSNTLAAFPMAAILIAFWQQFPDVGRLFLAYLYKECPYLVPYYIPQIEGQSNEKYLKLIGYRYSDSGLEPQEHYLKRLTGLTRLYSAILISKSKRSHSNVPNPYGLDNGWIWLSNVLNLDPLPDITATMIHEFLAIAGSSMWQQFGKQFVKLLVVLRQFFIVKLDKIDEGGPKARLEVLLTKMTKENGIQPPEGILPTNFW